MKTIIDRLNTYSQADINSDCILWIGSIGSSGYGHLNIKGKTVMAHRAIYEEMIGPIPEKYEIDHTCFVHNCVNPAHLEAVTKAENIKRYLATVIPATVCKHGHPLDGIRSRSTGGRYCKTCVKLNKRKQRAK